MTAAKGEVVKLSGNLDIRQAESLHAILKKLKGSRKDAILDFKDAEDIDLATLQLIYSFRKSVLEEDRSFSIENMNEKIRDRINLCDFTELLQES